MPSVPDTPCPIQRLRDIVHILRGPEGCPWDKEQSLESMTPYIIEEANELVAAIQSGNLAAVKDELGDVLLHVAMISEIASEGLKNEGNASADGSLEGFSMDEVAEGVCEKMIRRHPHVFGDASAESISDVIALWEKSKAEEKQGAAETAANGMDLEKDTDA